MSILFMDGFDHYGDPDKVVDGLGGWTSGSALVGASFLPGRFADSCLCLSANDHYIEKSLGANYSTLICGFHLKNPDASALLSFLDGTSVQFRLQEETNHRLSLYRFTDTGYILLASSSYQMIPGAWYYIEVKASFSETGGQVTVKVNGTAWIEFTGNTIYSSNAYANALRLSGPASFDNLYVLDTAGTKNNDFFAGGERRICTLLPSADSSQIDFTPLGGGSNYVELDDPSLDDDASYVHESTVNAKDRYLFDSLPSDEITDTIAGIMVVARARKDGTDPRQIKNVIKSNALEATGDAHELTSSYAAHADIWEYDPDGSLHWAVASVDALEIGFTIFL